MRGRLDMPKNIDDAHEYKPGSEPDQRARLALQLAREQERERHGEVEHHKEQANSFPSAIQAAHVPRNLFGQVARPDDEPLREIEVSPDHDESEHELAVVVDFGVGEVLGYRLALAEDALDDHGKAESGERFTRDEEQAVDGRDPARLQRHHPVDHSEGNRERVDDESNGAYGAETQRALALNRVLLGGPAIQEVGHPEPDGEVEDVAQQDAVEVEIAVRDFRDLGVGQSIGPGPEIQLGQVQQNRNEEHEHEGQRHHARLQDAANHRAPGAADQVVKHQDGHASERKAEPEHEAGEVGGIKTVGSEKSPGDGSNGSNHANDERPLLDGLGYGRGHQVRLIHGGRGHLGSPSVAGAGGAGAISGSVAPLPISRN